MPMTCWPPCHPWCDCIEGKCQPRAVKTNVVRLRTPNGRYLTAVNGGAGLTANFGTPSQSATFWLVSRPTASSLTIPPPATLPMPSGSQISLAVCSSNWALSANLMRAEHSMLTIQPRPPTNFWERLAWFFLGGPKRLVTYYFGGPDTFVLVGGPIPFTSPFTSDSNPTEWIFSIDKNGPGKIDSGDQISLRIDSSRTDIGPYYFRATSESDQAPIGADGVEPFQPDTVFVVEFHEVDLALGFRPPNDLIVCQTCGRVTGIVTDATTGQPIPNAMVEAQDVLENHRFSGTTDVDGGFTLVDPDGRDCIPPGHVTLLASADRYVPKITDPIPDPSSGGANVPISLDCTKVRGRVVDDNLPPNPQIYVQVALFLSDGRAMYATTDYYGTFVFECVTHGSAKISTPTLANRQINVLPEGIDVELKVHNGCVEILGTVTDTVTGLPMCNVEVVVFGTSNSARTDAQGKFRIPCASPGGTRSLIAIKRGYNFNWVVVSPFPPSGSVTKDITLEPTSIPSLFNTGVDVCGSPLADGTIGDTHYALFSVPSGTTNIRVRTSAGGYPIPPYIGDNLNSAWIVPNNNVNGDGPVGHYVWRTTFSLTGFDLSKPITITGLWSTDNDGVRIELNGVDTRNPPTAVAQYELGFIRFSITNVDITNGSIITNRFQPGLNTLDFIVNNRDGVIALRVEMTSTATAK